MMESFLGVPDTGLWLTLGLVIAATVTTLLGTVTGTAGGLLLLDAALRLMLEHAAS